MDGQLSTVIRAAGGVVWRQVNDDSKERPLEIAVIHRPRYDDWSMPKGKLAPGETDVEGAIREVFEETGYRVRLGRPLGKVRYLKHSSSGTRPKVVRYWAMEAETGSFSPTREVDELRWMTPGEAQEILTHDHDRDILQRFVGGPLLTGCVLLVRHGLAGSRQEWDGDDRERPLTEAGWAQAEELVRLLSRFEVQEIVSADFVRCTQSVQPLADALGLTIKEDEMFSELTYPRREHETLNRLRDMGASLDTTVVCSQGGVIPDLLERLALEDHVDIPDAPNKKGSVWALNFEGRHLFSAEYFPPPLID
jgi:8-oxo-dGTP diphosphatase